MTAWADVLVSGLWRAGWAVLPVAAVVAGICRFGKCSPSTRHALWLTTLACMVAAMWLPGPTVTAPPATFSAQDEPVYFVGRQTPTPQMAPVGLFVPLVPGRRGVERDSVKNKTAAPAQWAAETEPTPPRTAACSSDSSPAWLATTMNRLRRLSTFLPDCAKQVGAWVSAASPGADSPVSGIMHTSGRAASHEPRDPEVCELSAPCHEGVDSALMDVALAIVRPLIALPHTAAATIVDTRNELVAATANVVVPDAPVEPIPSIENALAASGRVLTTSDPNLLDPPPQANGAMGSAIVREWRRYASGILGVRDAAGRVPPMPTTVWALGFVAFAGVLFFRMLTAARRLRHAMPADADTRRMVEREARRLGLSSPPQAYLIADRVSPMIWCGREVRIILPQALWNDMDDDGRRAVVCHELAHLRRRDHWVRWIEIVVGCLYWWHPVMWWVRGKLSEEADACCDEWVTWVLPRERRAYAEALLAATDFVSGSVGPEPLSVAMASARASKIARRLTMIMTATRRPGLGLTGVFSVLMLGALAWVATPAQSCPPEEQEASTPAVAPVDAVAPVAVQTIGEPGRPLVAQRRALLTGITGDGTPPQRTSDWSDDSVTGDPDMAERLRQIEESQKRLSEELRLLSNALGRPSVATPAPRAAHGGSTLFAAPTPMASFQSTSPVDITRSPFGAVGMASTNSYPAAVAMIPGTRAEFDQPIVSRFYKLSGDRLEALTEIMLREDVPVCVMQFPDGIQVNGTEAQQAVFAAFIKMITANDKAADIKLPEEKLDAVKKLAALESVPTKFVIGPDSISVQGSPAEQAVFDAFIALIHPKTPSGSNRTPTPTMAPAMPAMPGVPAVPATPARAPRNPDSSGMRTPRTPGSPSATAKLDHSAEAKRAQEVERALAMNAGKLSGLKADHERAAVEATAEAVKSLKEDAQARVNQTAEAAALDAGKQTRESAALKGRRDIRHSERLALRSRVADLNAQRNQLEQLADHLEAEADAAESRAQGADKPEDGAKEANLSRQYRTQARQAQRDAARLDVQIEQLDQALIQLEIDLPAGR